MVRRARPHLTLLALLTASGLLCAGEGVNPLSAAQLSAIRGQETARVQQINQFMETTKHSLGLGTLDGLKETGRLTDVFGRTHVRYNQTYRGVEVWNGRLIGHLDTTGNPLPANATIKTAIELPPAKLLSEVKIKAILKENLPSQGGRDFHTTLKPIVFPTAEQDGLKFKADKQGKLTIDTTYSVASTPRDTPYVWAYHAAITQLVNGKMECTEFVVDGVSGEILKKYDGLDYDAPAVGTGYGQYNGLVNLNTLQLTNGTYELRDTTRPTKPWPTFAAFPEFTELGGIGSMTNWFWGDSYVPSPNPSDQIVYADADNIWGDGQSFTGSPNDVVSLASDNGQTAAVDAHYAAQMTWDYYKNVHGRDGIDNIGSSMLCVLHANSASGNAFWNPNTFLMVYGDGWETGSGTAFDVIAHEMSHGVNQFTANLRGAEATGLNESNSDVQATMARFWLWGADGTGSVVPDTTTKAPGGNNTMEFLWSIGSQLSTSGTPFRWMYKPSKDGYSFDGWFHGMGMSDSHYTSGPGNRAMFFLSQGASTSGDTSSVFLPSGMSGIGNDKAIKIWYDAMATKVTDPRSGYHELRDAMIASATQLYGPAEVAAVKNAFAAVNVGASANGTERVRVTFAENPIYRLGINFQDFVVAPCLTPVPFKAQVANATDTSVTWKVEGPYPGTEGLYWGKVLDNGTFVAPLTSGGTYIKAISKQDPNQFGVSVVFAWVMDCDADTDFDACDLGAMAMNFGGINAYPSAALLTSTSTILDVEVLKQGFNNAFNR